MQNFLEESEGRGKEDIMDISLKERKTEVGCKTHKEYSTAVIKKN